MIDSLNGYLNAMPEERFLIVQLHELLDVSRAGRRRDHPHRRASGAHRQRHACAGRRELPRRLGGPLRYFEARGEVRQAISVMKKRGGPHERTIREFRLAADGVRVGDAAARFPRRAHRRADRGAAGAAEHGLTSAASLEQRVLILAPTAKDRMLTCEIMTRAGVACESFSSLDALCAALAQGAGALLLPEESLDGGIDGPLGRYLAAQAPWSDLPILMLARPGAASKGVAEAMEQLGNITVLERPTRIAALVSATRTALRARQRQYQIRDHLAQREVAEQMLRQSVEQMQTLLETMPIGVFIAHDADCRLITGNRSASDILRMPPGANLSRSVDDGQLHAALPHPRTTASRSRRAICRCSARRAASTCSRCASITRSRTAPSSTRSCRRGRCTTPRGNPRGAVGAIMDVSAHLRSEAALREADRRKDEFLAMLAHELRNPLAPIRNALHLLRLATRPRSERRAARREMMERQVALHGAAGRRPARRVAHHARQRSRCARSAVELAAVVRRAVEASRAADRGCGPSPGPARAVDGAAGWTPTRCGSSR